MDRFLRPSLVFVALAASSAFATGSRPLRHHSGHDDVIATQVVQLFTNRCAECHSPGGAGESAIADILNLDQLIGAGIVIPGDPDHSLLFKAISTDEMPQNDPKLTSDQKDLVRQWIQEGALSPGGPDENPPADFVSPADVYQAIELDIGAQDAEVQPFLRYLSLVHLRNAGVSDSIIKFHTDAASKAINSLSFKPRVVALPSISGEMPWILRVDLRLFGIPAETWDKLAAQDPSIGVLGADPNYALIQQLTKSASPVVRGDWWVATATRPPSYYDFLKLPATTPELEALLQVDPQGDFDEGLTVRAGFSNSGVALHNRVIQRHETAYGSYWKSFDFLTSTGKQNIFAFPFGPEAQESSDEYGKQFEATAGEFIFNLPNGLQGYFIAKADGTRLDEAPVEVVIDRLRPDHPAITNGVACMSCHQSGIFFKADQIRSYVSSDTGYFTPVEREKLLTIHPDTKTFAALVQKDQAKFQDAVKQLGQDAAQPEPVLHSERSFAAAMSLGDVLTALGLTAKALDTDQDLKDRINQSQDAKIFFETIAAADGEADRAVFEGIFAELLGVVQGGDTPPPQSIVGDIAASLDHACARTVSGVRCWGSNGHMQIDVPSSLAQGINQVVAGETFSCALDAKGQVTCWGGAVVDEDGDPIPVVAPTGLGPVNQIFAGPSTACAVLTQDGTLTCWGDTEDVGISPMKHVAQVAIGSDHYCVITDAGAVQCFGDPTLNKTVVPPNLGKASQIAVGYQHSCALTQSGVSCWGDPNAATVPSGLGQVNQISASQGNTCALTDSGVRCWGTNPAVNQVPTDLSDPKEVSCGGTFACAVIGTSVRCWGDNSGGQLNVPTDLPPVPSQALAAKRLHYQKAASKEAR